MRLYITLYKLLRTWQTLTVETHFSYQRETMQLKCAYNTWWKCGPKRGQNHNTARCLTSKAHINDPVRKLVTSGIIQFYSLHWWAIFHKWDYSSQPLPISPIIITEENSLEHHTHQKVVKMKQLIKDKVWFPRIDKIVEETMPAFCYASISLPDTIIPLSNGLKLLWISQGPSGSGKYILVAINKYSHFPDAEAILSI